MTRNPYETKDGFPKEGQEEAWQKWELEQEEKRRNRLTSAERELNDANHRAVMQRRATEIPFPLERP